MKLLLDTTYLLPSVSIAIKEVSKDAIIKLNTKGYNIVVSRISIFELLAKSSKFVVKNELSPERAALGIRAILYDDIIEKISTDSSKVMLTAFKLRSLMNDFIDCLIISTALNNCDALITENQDIHNLKKNKKYLELVASINPNFKIQTLAQICSQQ
ncbi:MAG: PIN domain-containing protein [Candidatus Bathyarchaeia archaeon]